jgi:hypothetical protein
MKIGSRYELGLSCPEEGPVGSCEHSNENSGCIKDGNFFDYVRDYHLLMKQAVFAPFIKNRCRVTRIIFSQSFLYSERCNAVSLHVTVILYNRCFLRKISESLFCMK